MEDKRDVLRNTAPFSYKLHSDQKAQIFYNGKCVHIAVKKDYEKLLKVISENDDYKLQLCMAKMTGNFKHGNERK